MAIGGLAWWEVFKNFFKGVWESWLDYRRRQALRKEKEQEAKTEYEEAKKKGDASDLLNSFEKGKDNRE